MASKTTIANLDQAIKGILDEYSDQILVSMEAATKEVAKAAVETLKNESNNTFRDVNLKKGRYGSGWTSTVETGRVSAKGIIYNAKYPGLPHLLENGHANRGGGRTPGVPHIAPVAEKIEKEYMEALENAIK